MLVLLTVVIASAGVAPGVRGDSNEEPVCRQLRAQGVAPIPAYSDDMRVLMDSWNYQNLLRLPSHTRAVWDQVDNDNNNPIGDILSRLISNCRHSLMHA